MIPQEKQEIYSEEDKSVSGLINILMIKNSVTPMQLSKLTGLSETAIKMILSGNYTQISLGNFVNIMQALKSGLHIENDGITYTIDTYVTSEKMGH